MSEALPLRITRIEVENIRGITNGILEPKTITVLKGDNGTGKSSWLDAFRVVFDGGYDPKMVRKGEKKARVEMTLSDGTVCTRIINPEKKTSTLTVKSEAGEVIKAPQSYIEGIADSFAYDPLDFMFADKKKRQELIQEFLDVNVTVPEFRAAIQEEWFMEHYDPRKNGFDNIDNIYKAGYERRRKVNVQHGEADKTANTLRRDIPTLADDAQQFEAKAKATRLALEKARADKRADQVVLDEQYTAETARIDAWEREEIEKIHTEKQKQLNAALEMRGTVAGEINSQHDPIITEAATASDQASRALADYNEHVGLRKHLKQMEDRIKELAGESMRYDRALEALSTLKKQKMEDLPLPGAEMRDGALFIDGIDFDGLNTERQIEVCLQIAASRSKDLCCMLIDGIERLSEGNQRVLFDGLRAGGFQIIAAEVVDAMPLTPTFPEAKQ